MSGREESIRHVFRGEVVGFEGFYWREEFMFVNTAGRTKPHFIIIVNK